MKKCGFFENSDTLVIYVGLSHIKELAKDISSVFDIYAEASVDTVRIPKSPMLEASDIRTIKRYVGNWIANKQSA